MATINKRPSGKWQPTVRRDGKSRSMTFTKRADAVKWARDAEVHAERTGTLTPDTRTLTTMTLAGALHQLGSVHGRGVISSALPV